MCVHCLGDWLSERDLTGLLLVIGSIMMQGSASGSLYVDDGHSYKNKNGDYIHRTFTFSGRTLSSKPTHSAFMTVPSNGTDMMRSLACSHCLQADPVSAPVCGTGRFKTSCTVERVVILGYSAPVSKAFLVVRMTRCPALLCLFAQGLSMHVYAVIAPSASRRQPA